jgi:predicted O-methyltransferase YrrM
MTVMPEPPPHVVEVGRSGSGAAAPLRSFQLFAAQTLPAGSIDTSVSIWMLPPLKTWMTSPVFVSGRVLTCEIDAGYGAIAQRNWEGAGMADKVELRMGPALDTLNALLADRLAGHFDMAFIDADKENILAYYERSLALIRTGGFLLIDNTLWSGAVADPSNRDPVTETLRTLNSTVHADPRVEMVLIPIGDGLTLARKIS